MTTYEKLQDLCRQRGIRLSTLSKEAGISGSVFTELKTGRTKRLSAATLNKAARYFGVPVDSLLDDAETPDALSEQLYKKRLLLFDKSEKATATELDAILKLVDALIGDGEDA